MTALEETAVGGDACDLIETTMGADERRHHRRWFCVTHTVEGYTRAAGREPESCKELK